MSDAKPWLEMWSTEGRLLRMPDKATLGEIYCLSGEPSDRHERAIIRTRLAAAAPALVRALLVIEWMGDGGMSICPECGGTMPGIVSRWIATPGHDAQCLVDAALTAAGLPDQASRDAARREIGR